MERYKQEKEDEINKRIEHEKQMRISKLEASISQTVAQRIKKERDELTIKLNEKEKQFKELLDQKEVELDIAAVKVRFKEFEMNKKVQNDKDLEREIEEKNNALQQIETLNSQIDQMKRESVEHEHNLQVCLENLNRKTLSALQEGERSLLEIEHRKKTEEEKGIIKGENEILLIENARLKQLLGEERTNEEIQRSEKEKTKFEENIKHVSDIKYKAEQKLISFMKDRFSLIISLFKETDMDKLSLILWEELVKDLRQPLQDNDDENKYLQERILAYFEFIKSTVKDKKEDKKRKRMLQAGIVEALIYILETYNVEKIKLQVIQVFNIISNTSDNELLKILVEKQIYQPLILQFDHSNNDIVELSIQTITRNIVESAYLTSEMQCHPLFNTFFEKGYIDKIYELFKRNLSKYSKNLATYSIGRIFRSKEIINVNMKSEVIANLKTLINDKDYVSLAKLSLRGLSYNPVNKAEIETEGFIIPK
ncbi:MAG: hypothetical protein EZS28_036473 [Streblomastix strix]|uniref:Uncharacterized protein n=1 Tax=Streblomastix strix TaxID=222440 RepID=A0A5J4UCR6_9EUKA|nr:MAG: hypothetical protein EZS28_036473 [Streblomastix strix]